MDLSCLQPPLFTWHAMEARILEGTPHRVCKYFRALRNRKFEPGWIEMLSLPTWTEAHVCEGSVSNFFSTVNYLFLVNLSIDLNDFWISIQVKHLLSCFLSPIYYPECYLTKFDTFIKSFILFFMSTNIVKYCKLIFDSNMGLSNESSLLGMILHFCEDNLISLGLSSKGLFFVIVLLPLLYSGHCSVTRNMLHDNNTKCCSHRDWDKAINVMFDHCSLMVWKIR